MLHPTIDHCFANPVWRLDIDDSTGVLVTENRNNQDRSVFFSAIALNDGAVCFEGLHTEERWMTGIEAVFQGVLLLHHYVADSGPVHKGLVAIDERTGQKLWSDFNLTLDYMSVNGPVIYDARMENRRLYLADISTGKLRRQRDPSADTTLPNSVILPEETSGENSHSLPLPVRPLENTVHYLEHNTYRIVSLHAIEERALSQHIYILNEKMEIVYQDLLNTGVQKLQPESFLMHGDQLIYLKNQSQLKVLNL